MTTKAERELAELLRRAGIPVIVAEEPQQCDECGEVAECRPYGPGGRVICFPCLEAHPEWTAEAERRFADRMDRTRRRAR